MTTLRQAAQQALEALIDAANVLSAPMFADAVDALKAALAQQAEPVAYDKTAMNSFVQSLYDSKIKEGKHGHYETMFHVVHEAVKRFAPPQQQAEPVQEQKYEKRIVPYSTPLSMILNTAPPQQQAEPPPEWPLIKNIIAEYGLDAISFVAKWQAAQRPWVGLTPDEVKHLYPYGRSIWGKETFEAIEKALKDKNT